MLVWLAFMATDVLRLPRLREQRADEVGSGLAFLCAPPEEFVPPEFVGQPIVAIICCYRGTGRGRRKGVAPCCSPSTR
jgi:hypothetical protein